MQKNATIIGIKSDKGKFMSTSTNQTTNVNSTPANQPHLSKNLQDNIQLIASQLPVGLSYDLITREFYVGDTKAYLLAFNGLCKTDILQRIFSDLQNPMYVEDATVENIANYIGHKMGYISVQLMDSWEEIQLNVLCGPVALFLDGFAQAVVIDVRTYPTRSIEEPDMERVTKGSRDGFVEAMLTNANLLRRRVRSPKLVFSRHFVGEESQTDVAVAYLQDKVDASLLEHIEQIIDSLHITSLTMGAKSLEELIISKRWWNPLPCVLTTERPDVASSYLMEGHILVMVDNSPLVLVLPCSIFQFSQSPEDYYKSPLVGTYFRLVRFLCIPVSLLLMPTFLLIGAHFPELASAWQLMDMEGMTAPRLFFYVMAIEFILDLFQYSSALTSNVYSGALSIVSGLIIGEVAVKLQWATTEVLFYAAITLLASLSLSDSGFRDGIRLFRILLLLVTGFWGLPGYLCGLLAILISTATTPTFGGFSYLWPLFPFNKKALGRLLFRSPTPKAQPSTVWGRGKMK